ncbi:hypothetical protein [Aeromicrobium stalagmiti]|uniref:hypothetical protein n=1 Tax=Aeromicrobium stalagmiti TaxID=2738988 RepID=UPI001568F621|nr:hypothetical protein [Aeromicrobium stalagmiti]NRQ49664.1 hypothetical protein [Aeromicrobium stalagmiti]
MNLRPKKLAAAASVAVLVLGAAACGGSDDGAASKGSSSDSSSSSSSSSTGGELTKANFISSVTDAQLDAKSSHVVMDIGVGGQSIKAEGDVEVGASAAETSMNLTMDMGSTGMGSLKMVLVDSILYLNFGQMTGGKYAKIDLNDDSNPFAQQFGSITEQLDPSQQLGQFEAALTSFEKKGSPEKLDGVDAQPYEVVLDTTKIKAFSELPGAASAQMPKTLTYVMYVGSDNLLRRMTADVAGSKIQVDYSQWGEDIDVKAPAADEITDKDLSQLGAMAS